MIFIECQWHGGKLSFQTREFKMQFSLRKMFPFPPNVNSIRIVCDHSKKIQKTWFNRANGQQKGQEYAWVFLMTYVLGLFLFLDLSMTKNAYKIWVLPSYTFACTKAHYQVQLGVIICYHNRMSENVLTLSNMITMVILCFVLNFYHCWIKYFLSNILGSGFLGTRAWEQCFSVRHCLMVQKVQMVHILQMHSQSYDL